MEFIKTFVRENKPWSWILILFIAVPVALQMHLWPIYQIILFLTPGNHDTWIQFWGSYLGVIPSGIIAALVAGAQIKESNKQNHENAMQSLKVMNNTKLLNYYYDIKSSLAKSKVLFDEIDDSWEINDLYHYLYSPQRQSFEVLNLETLLQENNMLHLNVRIVNVNNGLKKISDALTDYSGNLILIEKIVELYDEEMKKTQLVLDGKNDNGFSASYYHKIYVEQSTNDKIKDELSVLIRLIDRKIEEISA